MLDGFLKFNLILYLVSHSLLAWEWHQTAKDQSGRLHTATLHNRLHKTRKLSVASYGQFCKYLKDFITFSKKSDGQVLYYNFLPWFVPFLQCGGIIADVNLSEHSATIRFSEYHDGAAPFLLINHTKEQTLHFYQRWESRENSSNINKRDKNSDLIPSVWK